MTRNARTTAFAAATVALTLLAACTSDADSDSVEALAPAAATGPANGPSSVVGNGTAWTYVVSDGAGKPTEVGVRMSGAALTGLATESHGEHPQPIVLTFPSGVA